MNSPLEFQKFNLDIPEEGYESEEVEVNIPQKASSSQLNLNEEPSKFTNSSFWTFEYYQQFFDVDTEEVKTRLLWAMFPRTRVNYLETCIKPNPDLYGPFWICATLIFSIAVSGNLANYLQYAATTKYSWKYDFHYLSIAATTIYTYTCVIPLALWSFMKWNNSTNPRTFMELLCAYGYSLAIYVPISVLWIIPVSWFQWSLVMIAAALSGYVLVTTVGPAIDGPKKIPILALVVALHFLLAAGFMLWFFRAPSVDNVLVPHNVTSSNSTKSGA